MSNIFDCNELLPLFQSFVALTALLVIGEGRGGGGIRFYRKVRITTSSVLFISVVGVGAPLTPFTFLLKSGTLFTNIFLLKSCSWHLRLE